MSDITGQIVACGPNISTGYAPGELAELWVECLLQGTRSWYEMSGDITILYSIEPFGILNEVLGKIHFAHPWTTYQEWSLTKTIALFPMANQTVHGTFRLLLDSEIILMANANIRAQPGPTPVVLDTKNFTIPVSGDGDGIPGNIPWKEIGIGLAVIAVVGLAVSAARR
jgi:hypothetical protein